MENEETKPLVLVVDDNPLNLRLLRGMLANSCNVITVDNGPEARDIAETERPALILLDVMMPGEDGYEVCTKLKENPSTAGIPIIFVTAMSDDVSKVDGLRLGAVDYVTKPYTKEELLSAINLHLKLSNNG
ncbi:MAG: response regulator [Nitrospinota bacterium]